MLLPKLVVFSIFPLLPYCFAGHEDERCSPVSAPGSACSMGNVSTSTCNSRENRLHTSFSHKGEGAQIPQQNSQSLHLEQSRVRRVRRRLKTIHWLRLLGEDSAGRIQFQLASTTWRPGVDHLPSEPHWGPTEGPVLPERPRGPDDANAWRLWRVPPARRTWRRLTALPALPSLQSRQPLQRPPPRTRYFLDTQVWDALYHLPTRRLNEQEREVMEGYLRSFLLPMHRIPPRVRLALEQEHARAEGRAARSWRQLNELSG